MSVSFVTFGNIRKNEMECYWNFILKSLRCHGERAEVFSASTSAVLFLGADIELVAFDDGDTCLSFN